MEKDDDKKGDEKSDNMSNWTPDESDIEWTRDLVNSLKIGGFWGTSFAKFKKVSESKFTIEQINPDPNVKADDNIEKVEKVFKILGIELEGKYDAIFASLIPNHEFFIGMKKKKDEKK
jgi:hypothetical protein